MLVVAEVLLTSGNPSCGSGGTGGGGAGTTTGSPGVSGTANTGGGGGGTHVGTTSGAGGSGVVILRMLDANYSTNNRKSNSTMMVLTKF
jgi:hypothetical protein